MSNYKITLPGLEAAANAENKSLFDSLTLPTGIDKETLTDNILITSDSFEVLYSDIDILTYMIGNWGLKNYANWKRQIDAFNLQYNPLENYDRMEEWTDAGYMNKRTDDDISGSESKRNSSSISTDERIVDDGETTDSGTTETQRAAYNEVAQGVAYSPYEKDITSGRGTQDNTRTIDSDSTSSSQDTNTNSSQRDIQEAETNGNHRTGRAHGNIGTVTSQSMLQAEIEIARWNIYNEITDDFMKSFIVMVYD